MSREQDFLLGAIEKDKVIAQQQARIEELKLALDKADPLDPSFLRYLELEQQLQAEREKSAFWERASTLMAGGHCEDKHMHWLLPYEPVLWCECGFRLELSDALTTQAPEAK